MLSLVSRVTILATAAGACGASRPGGGGEAGVSGGSSGGQGAAGSGDGGGSIALDQLKEQVTRSGCAALVRCHAFSDEPLCTAFSQAAPPGGLNSLDAAIAAARAGKSHYDPAAARSCLDALAAQPCTDWTPALIDVAPACQAMFTGTVSDGGHCIANEECLPASFCAVAGGTSLCEGVCMSGGAQCNDDTDCADGRICDTSVSGARSNGTCVTPVPPGAANEPCGTKSRCQAGLYCSSPALGTSPTCKPVLRSGEPCDVGGVIFSINFGPCADGLICASRNDGAPRTCLPYATRGEPCTAIGQCGILESSVICDLNLQRCVELPTTGPCFGSVYACDPISSFCDTSTATPTCQPYRALGQTCNDSGSCGPLTSGATCASSAAGSTTDVCMSPAQTEPCVP